MFAYIFKRLLLMIPTLFGVMLVTFAVTQFVPGGPVEQLVQQLEGKGQTGEASSGTQGLYRGATGLDEEHVKEIRALYGFDKPVHERFIIMMKNYLSFDFGESYFHNSSVIDLMISKLPVSISLGLWTFFIVYLTCIPLGIAKAVRDGTTFDVVTSTLILIGYSIPGFVLGITLLVLLRWRQFLGCVPAARTGVGQLGQSCLVRQDNRLSVAYGAADHCVGDRQFRGDDHADQEQFYRRNTQAICADCARQRA